MSSITGLLGEFGQVDYGAANAFMDAFAHARHREGAPWISIDWDTWSEVGMAVNTALPKEIEAHRTERLASGIRSAEGVAAFERVLGSGLPQMAVSPRDLRVRPDEGPREVPGMVAPLVAPHGRPVLSSTYAAPVSKTAQELEAIWRTLLGVEPIGVQDDFFELGGHSLLATQMLTRIRDAFGVRLSMSAIFEAPTIATACRAGGCRTARGSRPRHARANSQ